MLDTILSVVMIAGFAGTFYSISHGVYDPVGVIGFLSDFVRERIANPITIFFAGRQQTSWGRWCKYVSGERTERGYSNGSW